MFGSYQEVISLLEAQIKLSREDLKRTPMAIKQYVRGRLSGYLILLKELKIRLDHEQKIFEKDMNKAGLMPEEVEESGYEA